MVSAWLVGAAGQSGGGLVGKTDFTEEPLCGGKGVKTTASALWMQREGSRRGGREDGPEEVEEG